MLFEPEQTWLHEVIPERENRQTDIQCSTAQTTSDLPEEHIYINLK
jgi:hypothetical protein